jgi:hypothetical protein
MKKGEKFEWLEISKEEYDELKKQENEIHHSFVPNELFKKSLSSHTSF